MDLFRHSLGRLKEFESKPISILFRGGNAELYDAPSTFGIDIWFNDKKVFNAIWNSMLLKDYQLVSLKRGPWIALLLNIAETVDSSVQSSPGS